MADDVEMAEPDASFMLSKVYTAHKGDAKCLIATPSGALISAGRDETVKFWAKRRGEYAETAVYSLPKTIYPTSIAYFENNDSWRVFVGRKDGIIDVFGPGSDQPIASLKQHKQNVCCLHVDQTNKKLLSGSWDNTVVVWPADQVDLVEFNASVQALLLLGHTLSVWAVATLPDLPDHYLSASADKTIRLWKDDTTLKVFTGHTDVVRSLIVLSSTKFLSSANDSSIRLWDMNSETALHVVKSTCDSFLYSIKIVDSYIIAAAEGGHIDIWRLKAENESYSVTHSQMMQVPSISLWSVASISDTDFGVCSSDGRIYIYTLDPSKKAEKDVINNIDAELALRVEQQLMRMEEEKKEDIVVDVALDDSGVKLKLRYKKGTDPSLAAQQFIQDNKLSASYLNEITEFLIKNVPEARMAQNKNYSKQITQKTNVDGKLYDFAFEVTVDGKQCILPHNVSDEPEESAQRFVEKYNLPIKYLGQFANFIRTQVGGGNVATTAQQGFTSEYADPFTGGGRYVPSQQPTIGGGADPFTGSGRYCPPPVAQQPGSMDSAGDPFTSSGRYIPGTADSRLVPNACLPVDKKRPRGEFVPLTDYYYFGPEHSSEKALLKLREMNEQQTHFKLTSEQVDALGQLTTREPDSITNGSIEVSAIDTCLQWPVNKDFSVVMNVFRLALLHKPLNDYYCSSLMKGEETKSRLIALLVCDDYEAVRVLACRAIANAFRHESGQKLLFGDANLLSLVMKQILTRKAHLQLAAASALANLSLLLLRKSETVAELGPREDLLRSFIKDLEGINSFGDFNQPALFRLLQAIVTTMWGDAQVITLGKNRNLIKIINAMKDAMMEESGKNIARDIVEMVFAV